MAGQNLGLLADPATTGSVAPPVPPDKWLLHKQIYNALIDRGVKPQVAVGAIGSLMGESSHALDPTTINRNDAGPGNHSYGFGQWNRGRADSLFNTAKGMGKDWSDPAAQVAHMGSELDGKWNYVLKGLQKGNTMLDGTSVWTKRYEVPKNADYEVQNRYPHAQAFAKAVPEALNPGHRFQFDGAAPAPALMAPAPMAPMTQAPLPPARPPEFGASASGWVDPPAKAQPWVDPPAASQPWVTPPPKAPEQTYDAFGLLGPGP
ncbi:hypothetical protein FF100_21975 [Methylobacterium terricola]|uniref:Phage tail lysozyme domain-containing protein n=1 Tax=Methylobacterium terricola TaxID=2583531 RepID=A0A5C4LDK8_9HYPH|nr:phage tail tip lysozyme [Methylobacterium terricola]TNC10821.1 hypothetical protein FF100_21975 [Methylobacterium terricola]